MSRPLSFDGLQSQRLAVELLLLRDVRRRESTERFAVFQHDNPPPSASLAVAHLVPKSDFSHRRKGEHKMFLSAGYEQNGLRRRVPNEACWNIVGNEENLQGNLEAEELI